jgi:hypothetical protein
MANGNNTNVHAAMDRLAEQIAKDNAPWTDRTGDARKLIKGIILDNKEETITYKKANGEFGTTTIDGEGCVGFALAHRFEAVREIFGGR